jgi:hypothetical protein
MSSIIIFIESIKRLSPPHSPTKARVSVVAGIVGCGGVVGARRQLRPRACGTRSAHGLTHSAGVCLPCLVKFAYRFYFSRIVFLFAGVWGTFVNSIYYIYISPRKNFFENLGMSISKSLHA